MFVWNAVHMRSYVCFSNMKSFLNASSRPFIFIGIRLELNEWLKNMLSKLSANSCDSDFIMDSGLKKDTTNKEREINFIHCW